MRILAVNNCVSQSKYRLQMKRLCAQVAKECEAKIDELSFRSFNPEFIDTRFAGFDAVVLSGTEALLSKQDERVPFCETISAIKNISVPVLGICGGEQLIGLAYGQPVVQISSRRLIRGYRNVETVADDLIFDDLPRLVSVMQSHYEMVQSVPDSFSLLARSKSTPVEAFGNVRKALYGVQFHPEFNDRRHPAGRKIISNFGRLVKQ